MCTLRRTVRLLSVSIAFFVAIAMMPTAFMDNGVYGTSKSWETENNNTKTYADKIVVNNSYYGKISSMSDADFYKFTISSPGPVSVNFNHEYIDDVWSLWDIYLLDSSGNELVSTSSDGEEETLDLVKMGLPAGTYFVKIKCADGGNTFDRYSSATYNFTVNYSESVYWETEANEHKGQADSISVNETYSGTIFERADNDYYMFTLPSDGCVNVTFSHDYYNSDDDYWDVHLLDADRNEIDVFSSDGTEEILTSTSIGLPAGNYYLVVKCADGGNTFDRYLDYVYSFKVTFTPSTVWETETNEHKAEADIISLNEDYYGTLISWEDHDYYKLELATKSKLKFKFNHDYINSSEDYWKITIKDSEECEIETKYIEGNDTAYALNLGYYPSGVYYVAVEAANYHPYSENIYTFSIDKIYTPYTTKLTSLKAGKKSATLRWKKSSDAKGYQIYRATSKKGKYKRVKTVTSKSTIKYVNKKLKKGKTYYYKIRSYRIEGGIKYYSAFSSVKKVKIKK